MIFVQGGSYKPVFCDDRINIINLYVSKFQVTQEEWQKIMKYNPSHFKGEKLPVENITWIEALEFCNKLSEICGLQPVYKIQGTNKENDKKLIKIIYKDKIEVNPDEADFSKTEGYRLPLEVEWEWFARGGIKAVPNTSLDIKYSGSKEINEVAWYVDNSNLKSHEVGLKKPNELGLYDCTGNVWEWCYDTASDFGLDKNIPKGKNFLYNIKIEKNRRIRSGSWHSSGWRYKERKYSSDKKNDCGFRIVRTANSDEIE